MKKYQSTLNKQFANKLDKFLESSKSIVITAHMGQDDDAVSCLLLAYEHVTNHLKKNATEVRLIVTGVRNGRWEYFKNYDKVEFVDDLADHLESSDTLVMLDGSDWYRFSKKEEIRNYKGKTICIDHHPNPIDTHDLHLVDQSYVSCAEIMYELFFDNRQIEKDVAEIVFLGVWGDTGGLRFVRPDKTSSFELIGELVHDHQINIQSLLSKYEKIDTKVFQLLVKLMNNTLIEKVGDWPSFQYSYLNISDVEGLNESIVKYATNLYMDHFLRMISGSDWGFIITPKVKDKTCGVSIRSLPGSINAMDMMRASGLGGGHVRAAGGTIDAKDPKKAKGKLLKWMERNDPVLN